MAFDPLKADSTLAPEDNSTGVDRPVLMPTNGFNPQKADSNLFPAASVSESVADAVPAQESKAAVLARKHGLQPDTVRTMPREVAAMDLSKRIDSATPTVRSALMDIDFTRQAKDDIENLSYIEKMVTGLWPTIKEGWSSVADKIQVGALDAQGKRLSDSTDPDFPMQNLRDFTGIRNDADLKEVQGTQRQRLFDSIMASEERVADLTPDNLDIVQQGFRGGVTSLVTQAPAFAATLATRNPAFALWSMSAYQGADSYGSARIAGKSPGESLWYGTKDAAIEYVTEMFPTGRLVDAMGPNWKRALADFAVGELGGEQLATFLQSMNAVSHDLDKEWDAAITVGDKAKLQAERQAVTFVSTLVAGGSQAAIARGIGDLQSRMQGGEKDQQRLAKLNSAIENSELRKNNPEAFKELLAKMGKDTGTENIYLDPEQANVFFQSGAVSEELLNNPAVAAILDDIPRAMEEGRSIEIPLEAYAVDLVGTEVGNGLAAHMKLDPDALTPAEALNDDIQQRIDDLVAMDEEQRTASSDVYNAVLGQLMVAEDRSTAESHAILWEATFQAMAARPGIKAQGLSAFDLYQRYNPGINREIAPEVRQKLASIDQIDVYLDSLRAGDVPRETDMFGQSALEFIKASGGLVDTGGELAARDAGRGIIRKNGRTLDDMAEQMVEAGYITERTEQAVLDALDNELAGNPVYALGAENANLVERSKLLGELDQMLQQAGIDLDEMTNEQIKAALETVAADGVLKQQFQDTPYAQALAKFGPEGMTQEARMARAAEQGYDTSKVWYHGAAEGGFVDNIDIKEFDESKTGDRYGADEKGFFFTNQRDEASGYAMSDGIGMPANGAVYPVHLNMRNPLVVNDKWVDDTFGYRGPSNEGNVSFWDNNQGDILKEAQRGGHDSIIVDDGSYKMAVIFEPKNIRSVNAAFDPDYKDSPNLLYQSGQGDAFDAWSGGAEVIDSEDINDTDFREGETYVMRAYHGTTHEFSVFNSGKKGTKEGHFGAINYFTSSKFDADQNYAGDGPDLTMRIERRAEQLSDLVTENPEDYGVTAEDIEARGDDLVYEIARKELSGGSEITLEVYVKTTNPFVVDAAGGPTPWTEIMGLDLESAAESIGDSYGVSAEEAMADYEDEVRDEAFALAENRLVEAIDSVASEYDFSAQEIQENLYDALYEPEQSHGDLEKALRGAAESLYIEDSETGDLIGSHVVSKIIQAMGYDAIILKNADQQFSSMDIEPGTAHIHVFDENNTNIKSVDNQGTYSPDNPDIYKQPSDKGPRGFFNPDTNQITLTANADLSTFLHESAHFFLEVMRDLAPMDESLQADMAALDQWWADNGATDYTAQHEMFASGFEEYLMEGKAPTAGLRSIFSRFSMWLGMVYKRLGRAFARNNLEGIKLSDEVRRVMDRLVASQEAIDEAQRQQEYGPANYEQLGLSPEEAAELHRLMTEADDEANRDLTTQVMRELQRERTAWWKKQLEEKAKGIAEDLNQQPEYLARDFLNGDRVPEDAVAFKLNLDYIRGIYGKTPARRLQRLSAKDGMNPDLAAPLLGYSSGDALVRSLLGTKNKGDRAKYVNALATEAMRAEHGDMLTDGTLAEAAQTAVHSEKQADLLLAELRVLNKVAGNKQTPRQLFKAAAERTVAQTPIYKLRPDQHKRNETKARHAALKAAVEGDAKKAAMESHRALRQFYLYKESLAAKARAEKIGDYGRSFKGSRLDRIKKSGDHYYEQIAGILQKFEFRNISNKKIMRRLSMKDWIEKTMAQAGEGSPFQHHETLTEDQRAIADQEASEDSQGNRPEFGITDAMMNEADTTNYRTLTLPELEAVNDALKSVHHLSKLKNMLLTQKDKRELKDWVYSLIISIDNNAKGSKKHLSFGSTRSRSEDFGRKFNAFMDITRTPTSILKMLDGYDNDGIAWQLVGTPLQNAAADKTERMQVANRELENIFSRYTSTELGRMNVKRYDGRIADDITHHDVISILLNWGNEGGRRRVLDGFKINEDTAHYLMNTYLTEKDYLFAKDVWAYLETFKAESFALHKDMWGFTPEEVEALPFESKFGTMPGGYYPIKYDSEKSARAEQQAIAGTGDSFTSSIQSKKKLGSTIARQAKVMRALNTDMTSVIFGHVSDVIHHVTHDRALFDVGRILANDGVKHSITQNYGQHIYQQLTSAVRNLKDGTEPARDIMDRVAMTVRNNATLAMLGASIRTIILQPFGLTNSFVKARMAGIGGLNLANGYARYMKNPQASARQIREESKYMLNREQVQSVAISRIKNKIRNAGTLDAVREATMIPIVKMQFYSVDAPLYMAARDYFIENGADREKAIGLAEQVVRDAQGGGGMFDTAEAMMGGPWKKLFTNFLTYSITTYNLQAENYQRTRRGDQNVFDFAVNTFVLMTMPAILTMLLNMAAGGDDESWEEQLAREQASFVLSMNPLTAQASSAVQGFDYSGPQGTAIIGKIGQLGIQAGQGEVDDSLIRSGIWVAGLATGLPAAQINRTIFGLKQAADEGDNAGTTVKKALFGPEYNK